MSINIKNNTSKSVIFQNISQDFADFTGQVISSTSIKEFDFSHSSVAIIGTNQDSVTHLEKICQQAKFVTIFQITLILFCPIVRWVHIS